MIDLHASRPHYLAHLAPIFRALPFKLRGRLFVPRPLLAAARELGDAYVHPPRGPLTLVASPKDRDACTGRVIYVEHGAGQTYPHAPEWIARNPSYSGGRGHHRAALFLAPNGQVAERWLGAYPATPVAVVGSPFLDRWHRPSPAAGTGPLYPEAADDTAGDGRKVGSVPTPPGARPPTVAVSFHWDVPNTIPELLSAAPHYLDGLGPFLEAMSAAGVHVLGHAHPRAWHRLRHAWERLGVEPVRDFAEVLDRADLYAVDNSSTGPEFASTGRPIIWLNHPAYRRDVHHGGRFWEWTEGIPTVDGPEQLADAALAALSAPQDGREAREHMVGTCYAYRDGLAAQRAAEAIAAIHLESR